MKKGEKINQICEKYTYFFLINSNLFDYFIYGINKKRYCQFKFITNRKVFKHELNFCSLWISQK